VSVTQSVFCSTSPPTSAAQSHLNSVTEAYVSLWWRQTNPVPRNIPIMHYYLYCVQFTYQHHAANQMGSPPRNRRDIWSELGQ